MIEIVTLLAAITKTGLSLLEKHIDDPVRRMKVRQEYIDGLKEAAAKIIQEAGHENIDQVLTDFVSAIHAL